MEVIHVGLMMQDREYARVLARTLAAVSGCMHFHMEGGEWDLMLLGEDDHPERSGKSIVRLCRLREDADPEQRRFWRYADAEEIAAGLVYAYYLKTGRVLEHREKKDFRLVVFASARGGCGTTSLCISVARKLAENQGRKILYLNTSASDDSMRYFQTERQDCMRSLLMRMRRGSVPPLKTFIREGEWVDRIPGSSFLNAAAEVSGEEMAELLRAVSSCGKYEYVFLDAGADLFPCNRRMIASSDVFVSICSGRGRDRYSEERRTSMEKLASCVIRVENLADPVSRIPRNGFLQAACEPDAFVTMNGTVQIQLNNAYGMDAAEIAVRIEEESGHDREYEAYHAGDPAVAQAGAGTARKDGE